MVPASVFDKMVRNYKRKKEIKYTQDQLIEAVEAVRKKKMNSYNAAETYGIPRSTIVARLYGTRGAKMPRAGRPTVLSMELEMKIASYIHLLEKCGYPLTKKEIIAMISEYIRRNGIITPFTNDVPGKEWFQAFRKRHKLSYKKPQSVEIARVKACNPFIIYDYFDILEKVTQELELTDKPEQIFNLDETSFCSDPSKSKIIGLTGYKSTRTTSGPGRENTTVLLATSASGTKIPPLVIFQGKYLWNEWMYQNEYVKTAYAVSQKGWMETSIFEKYLKEVFIPAVGDKRPVLLIYDGHSTHVDLSVIELAASNDITIIKLPPHSSHVLQPLDCSTMKAMKDKWEDALVKWQRLHVGMKLPKAEFARIITEIWDSLNPVILQNGFRKTGIFPINRHAIQEDTFDSLSWLKWKQHLEQQPCANNSNTEKCLKDDSVENRPKFLNHDRASEQVLLLKQFNSGLSDFSTESSDQFNFISSEKQVPNLLNLVINKVNSLMDSENYLNSNVLKITDNLRTEIITNKQQTISNIKHPVSDISKPWNEPTAHASYNNDNSIIHQTNGAGTYILPLQNKPATNWAPSIKILSNEVVSFEQLILQSIARNDIPKKTKKRVKGAEVLTYKDAIERIKNEKNEKEAKKKKKKKGVLSNANKVQKSTKRSSKRPKTSQRHGLTKRRTKRFDSESSSISSNCSFELADTDSEYETLHDYYIAECLQEQEEKEAEYLNQHEEKEAECSTQHEEKEYFEPEIMFGLQDPDYLSNECCNGQEEKENVEPEIPFGLQDIKYFSNEKINFKEHDWIVARFSTKKSVKHFVGQILSIDDAKYPTVKFVRKVKNSKSEMGTTFTYPTVEDVCIIKHLDDVIVVLPEPKIARRGQLIFFFNFSDFNVQ